MRTCRAVVERTGALLCERLWVAEGFLARLRGLMFRRALPPDEGLYIPGCSSIHMFFMRFPIDAVYVDRAGVVLKIVPGLKPWRLSGCRGAHGILELSAGAVARADLARGDRLRMLNAEACPPELQRRRE